MEALAALGRLAEQQAHRLYLAFALPSVVWLALYVPPFQVPDEFAHFFRVYQVSQAKLLGDPLEGRGSGGWIDVGIPAAMDVYHGLAFKRVQLTSEEIARSRAVQWSGSLTPIQFPNTVYYGPAFYVPQAAGVLLGRALGLGVIDCLLAARVMNGLVACVFAFVALRICRYGKAAMLAVLLLPMTVFLFGSVSQDALLIATSSLAIALVSRVIASDRRATTAEVALFSALVGAGACARPPHLALFLLVPLLCGRKQAPVQWWIIGTAVAIALGWLATSVVLHTPSLRPHPGESPGSQFAYLADHPLMAPLIAYNTVARFFSGWTFRSFVGILGWLDTPLPGWHYLLAAAALASAVVADARGLQTGGRRVLGWASLALLAYLAGLHLAAYAVWSPIGAPAPVGVQGRYFLPLAPLAVWLTTRIGAPVRPNLQSAAWFLVAAFPLALAVLPLVIQTRYPGP